MTRLSTALLSLSAALVLIVAPGCSSGDSSSPTASQPGASAEEPLDPMDNDDSNLQLGKDDAPNRVLPAFDKMWANYPHGTADEVKTLIGGNVDADWITNTCTIRVSRSLNYADFLVPSGVKGLNTVRGGDDLRYAYRVAEMRRYFKTVLGPATITSTTPEEFVEKITDHRGVLVFTVTGWSDATGHFDLWDGTQCAHQCYFDKASKIELWEAPE